jgi:hypothetical protein
VTVVIGHLFSPIMRIFNYVGATVVCALVGWSCSGGPGTTDGSGGRSGSGGSVGSGGMASSTGGVIGTGGAVSSSGGSVSSTGGSTGSGGTTSSSGGMIGTGGSVATGGSTAPGGAGVGGKFATGGASGSGGVAGVGGKLGAGGTAGSMGAAGAGGKLATGGSTGSGGGAATGSACGAGLTPTVTVTTAAQLITAFTDWKAGDVISVGAGTYLLPGKAFKLTASNVKVFGVAGKTILDYQATATNDAGWGIDISGSSNSICGLTIARAADNGIRITGDSNTIDRCEFYGCFDSGLQISGPEAETPPHPAKNLIINCDSHDNYDTKASGGNADGFASKINIGPGNKFFGCVAHDNSDDGWDTFPKTATGTNPVVIENCVSYHNGYHNGSAAGNGNGFKVGSDQTGGSAHTLKNCVAFNNPSKGLDQNHNMGATTVQNCTAVNNDRNVAFQEAPGANITNTVANGEWDQAGGTDTGNVKNAPTSAFTNLTPSSIGRDADGTLHLNGFCNYTASSAGAHF